MYEGKIIKKSEEIKDRLIQIRRDIHAHPELGFNEYRTSALVIEHLNRLGIDVVKNVGKTGVLGILKGKSPGKVLLLRADMDCLEMQELNDLDYKSKCNGLMHGCGHDAHTSWLLGAAMILSELKDELNGTVKFLFQPAEEGLGGAVRTLEDKVLENPKVDAVIGAHVWPTIEAGKIGVKIGPMMAGPDQFKIVIRGKGGHGAEPHNTNDPISIACQVYMGLQSIVSRRIDPTEPVVLSIATFNGGTAPNVTPDFVEMTGTVRVVTNEMRDEMPKRIESIIKGITEASGGTYELEYNRLFPPLITTVEATNIVKEAGIEILGTDGVVELEKPFMASEDFANFLQRVPGTFFIVGTHNEEKGIVHQLHNSRFNIDEDIIPKTASIFAKIALNYLSN